MSIIRVPIYIFNIMSQGFILIFYGGLIALLKKAARPVLCTEPLNEQFNNC